MRGRLKASHIKKLRTSQAFGSALGATRAVIRYNGKESRGWVPPAGKNWRPHRESNPGLHRERVMS